VQVSLLIDDVEDNNLQYLGKSDKIRGDMTCPLDRNYSLALSPIPSEYIQSLCHL